MYNIVFHIHCLCFNVFCCTYIKSYKTSQVTYVTLVPRGNETLRPETLWERDRALNTCVICPTDGRDVTGG